MGWLASIAVAVATAIATMLAAGASGYFVVGAALATHRHDHLFAR